MGVIRRQSNAHFRHAQFVIIVVLSWYLANGYIFLYSMESTLANNLPTRRIPVAYVRNPAPVDWVYKYAHSKGTLYISVWFKEILRSMEHKYFQDKESYNRNTPTIPVATRSQALEDDLEAPEKILQKSALNGLISTFFLSLRVGFSSILWPWLILWVGFSPILWLWSILSLVSRSLFLCFFVVAIITEGVEERTGFNVGCSVDGIVVGLGKASFGISWIKNRILTKYYWIALPNSYTKDWSPKFLWIRHI